jgi:hypothetical protein
MQNHLEPNLFLKRAQPGKFCLVYVRARPRLSGPKGLPGSRAFWIRASSDLIFKGSLLLVLKIEMAEIAGLSPGENVDGQSWLKPKTNRPLP